MRSQATQSKRFFLKQEKHLRPISISFFSTHLPATQKQILKRLKKRERQLRSALCIFRQDR